jgi:hypothetical protein
MTMSQFDKATMDAGCNNVRLMMWIFVDVECKDWWRTTFVEVKCNNGKKVVLSMERSCNSNRSFLTKCRNDDERSSGYTHS